MKKKFVVVLGDVFSTGDQTDAVVVVLGDVSSTADHTGVVVVVGDVDP